MNIINVVLFRTTHLKILESINLKVSKMENAQEFYRMDSNSQNLKAYAEKRLCERILQINPQTIIEVGSGDGHLLRIFSDRDIYGMDVNPDMVRLAHKKGTKIQLGDITNRRDLESLVTHPVDLITANYVFTELTTHQLEIAFKHIHAFLKQSGRLCFTMTNPKERHRETFPGYRLVFDEDYDYNRTDLRFKVELEDLNGTFIDVGIRDFHQPIQVYEELLLGAKFSEIKLTEIVGNLPYAFAILCEAIK